MSQVAFSDILHKNLVDPNNTFHRDIWSKYISLIFKRGIEKRGKNYIIDLREYIKSNTF